MADIKRSAFKEKLVKDIGSGDFKVSLTGTVVGKKEGGFLLADGTGEVYVNASEVDSEVSVSESSFVRVFGNLMPFEEGHELQAEILQDMNGVNKEALNKIREKLSSF